MRPAYLGATLWFENADLPIPLPPPAHLSGGYRRDSSDSIDLPMPLYLTDLKATQAALARPQGQEEMRVRKRDPGERPTIG